MSRPRKGEGAATVGFGVRVNFDPGTRLEDLLEDAAGIMESVTALLDNLTGQQPSDTMMSELFGAWHLARLAKAFVERASYQAIREAETEKSLLESEKPDPALVQSQQQTATRAAAGEGGK